MQEMQKQALERQKQMMSRGGENPWEAGYSKEMDKGNKGVDQQDNAIKDNAGVFGSFSRF